MATTFAILGQSSPTVPLNTNPLPVLVSAQSGATAGVVVSSIVVSNRSLSATDYFYIKVSQGGAGTSNPTSIHDKQYLSYKVPIAPNSTVPLVFGITLGSSDVIIAYSENGNCSFNAFGSLNS